MDPISFSSFFDKRVIWTALVAGFLLVVANSAIWANDYLFNTQKFTQTAVTSVTSDSSRHSIASAVTGQALKNYPVVQNAVQDPLNNLIAGLLDTQQAKELLTRSVTKLHVVLTSEDREEIAIDLRGIKSTLTTLLQITGREQTSKIQPSNFPDKLVILDPSSIPDLYHYGVALLWIAPLAGIGALALLAFPYIRYRGPYLPILITQGIVVACAGLLALLIGPLFQPIVLSKVNNPDLRVVVENLYNAFLSTFDSQSQNLIGVGIAVVIVGIAAVFARRYLPQITHRGAK